MKKNNLFLVILLALASLNLGSIRKAEDPIRDTQANPILYEQKKEEEKDGKKGPLMYHVKYNRPDTFFVDPPYDANEKKSSEKSVSEAPAAPTDSTGWWQEQAAVPQTESSGEATSQPAPESFSEEQKPEASGAGEPSSPEGGTEKSQTGKEDEYWW